MGQYAKAEPLYLRSLKIDESTIGPDHPDVARYELKHLALLHAATERWSDAVYEIDRAVADRPPPRGPHPACPERKRATDLLADTR